MSFLKIVFKNIFTIIFATLFFLSGCDVEKVTKDTVKDKNTNDHNRINTEENIFSPEISKSETIVVNSTPQIKTLYAGEPDDPIYKYQWHSKFLHLEDIWPKYTGDGIRVAVVDSGVQITHPDLYNNMDFKRSYRYSDHSNNPSPDKEQLRYDPYGNGHGTACAGIIGASGWNGIGVIGVAPTVDIVGLNPFSTGDDADFEDALGRTDIDISSNSWGGENADTLYDDPSSLRGIEKGIKDGRGGKGVIYLIASGNEGGNSNYSTLHGSRYVLNIGAVIKDGNVPKYSNYGDNLLITAPAGDQYKLAQNWGIFTTDLLGLKYGFDNFRAVTPSLKAYNGDYTGFMNGTSSAVPVASGVVALILEANPNLTYRDVKYILAKSATPLNIDNSNYQWETNGADILYSPFYGFGVINPLKAIDMAENFESLPSQKSVTQKKIVNQKIPDGDSKGISSEIEIDKSLKIEYVQIRVDIPDHRNISDLNIKLISPSGTESNILFGHKVKYGTLSNWEFSSLKFLDEDSQGVWRLEVSDSRIKNQGTLRSWTIFIYGR